MMKYLRATIYGGECAIDDDGDISISVDVGLYAQYTMYTNIAELKSLIKECESGNDEKPDLSKCPNCGGPADNGHDRCLPPNPYYCTKCENL